MLKRTRSEEGLSSDEKRARALFQAEQEATDAVEDGDYVGVIFDQNDFRMQEATTSSTADELDMHVNSIGYAPATLKVKTFDADGNILNKMPTGS